MDAVQQKVSREAEATPAERLIEAALDKAIELHFKFWASYTSEEARKRGENPLAVRTFLPVEIFVSQNKKLLVRCFTEQGGAIQEEVPKSYRLDRMSEVLLTLQEFNPSDLPALAKEAVVEVIQAQPVAVEVAAPAKPVMESMTVIRM